MGRCDTEACLEGPGLAAGVLDIEGALDELAPLDEGPEKSSRVVGTHRPRPPVSVRDISSTR